MQARLTLPDTIHSAVRSCRLIWRCNVTGSYQTDIDNFVLVFQCWILSKPMTWQVWMT